MPVTSPDQIPYPDKDTPYTYSADMKSMADKTQAALEKRGGAFRGTATQRVSQLLTVPRGAYWFDTTDNKTYRRGATDWIVWDEPTWTPITLLSSFNVAPSGPRPKARIVGGTVNVVAGISAATVGTGAYTTLWSGLPDRYHTEFMDLVSGTTKSMYFPVGTSSLGAAPSIRVYETGNTQYWGPDITSTNTTLNISISWPVAGAM